MFLAENLVDPSIANGEANRARMKACNAVIDEYWDYTNEDREKAIRISHEYFERFGDPDNCTKYVAPWLRPHRLDASEQ